MSDDLPAWRDALVARDRAHVARALNLAEDRRPDARSTLMSLLDSLPTHAHRVGITGPPGVGKSTLTAALTRTIRARGQTVGVVAVDPSSLASGGSLLGDRARMGFDPDDSGIFVRSMATHGVHGGIAAATPAAIAVLAAGFDVVVVETTGVGQTEVDVRHSVDTTAMVIQPGSGDTLQFIKAGIMEIPDLFVVNKADQGATAERALADLQAALRVQHSAIGRAVPPCLATSATSGAGIDAFADALEDAAAHISADARAASAVEAAIGLFTREHGEHGVRTLGGVAAIRQRLADTASVWSGLATAQEAYRAKG